MGKPSKRAQSALRYNADEVHKALALPSTRVRMEPAMTDEHVQDTFVPFVAAEAAADYRALLKSQHSVSLQHIWSRISDGTLDLKVLQPLVTTFAEQTPLSEPQAKALRQWIADGGLAKRAVEVYEIALRILEGSGFVVPRNRGGAEVSKRGRVTQRR